MYDEKTNPIKGSDKYDSVCSQDDESKKSHSSSTFEPRQEGFCTIGLFNENDN